MNKQLIDVQLALLSQQMQTMMDESRSATADMKAEIGTLKSDMADIKMQAAKWKGAFGVMLGAAAFLIGLITAWEKIGVLFKN
ncbi:hypothetical protein [Pararhizobium sp. IMCC21322]|uniref:hypothetical protein n=1 Tax=Pararhizobium sp. IMCC21322 TaxID=3067903 RepID=UPI0027409797|nr:hypothetical protein [Pararhizobium sp. IMCC21322]